MHRYEKILVAAVVALPLALAFVGAPLLRPDTGDLNRNPVPFPSLSANDFLATNGYKAIGDWLRDRVPFRRLVRKVDVKIDRGLFHDIDDAMILQGRDGWMFFEPAIGLGLLPDHDPEKLRAAILRLKREVEAAGKQFLFVYAPHKPTIYSDKLADRDRRRQEAVRKRLDAFRDLMRRQPVEGFIDTWDEMKAAAAAAPEPLYYPRDTHWTPLGAVEVTRKVVDTLSPGIESSLAATRLKPRKYIPDLVKYAGLEQTETIHFWNFERPGVTWKRADAQKTDLTFTRQFTAASDSGAPLLPNIVVICDSYGTSMYPSLRLFFESTTFIQTGSTDTELARQALSDAEIVLFLRVERFMWQTSEEMPFADESEEVIGLLETLRRHSQTAPPGSLTDRSPRASGIAAYTTSRRPVAELAWRLPPKAEELR